MSKVLCTRAEQLLALALDPGSPDGEVQAVVNALRQINKKGTLYTDTTGGQDENNWVVATLTSDLAKSAIRIATLEVELAAAVEARRMAEAQLGQVVSRADTPKRRHSNRLDIAMKEVMELFERQSFQASIDIIARKVNQPKAKVEQAVAKLVADGWVTRISSMPYVSYVRSKNGVV